MEEGLPGCRLSSVAWCHPQPDSLLEGVLDPGHNRLLTRSRVDFLRVEDRMISETAVDPVA